MLNLLFRNREPALHSVYNSEYTVEQKTSAGLLAFLLIAGCTSSAADTPASSSRPSRPVANGNPHKTSTAGPLLEVQEFGANAFEQLENGQTPGGSKVFIRMGEKILALCHIPPDGTESSSFRKGGFYIIRSPAPSGDDLIKTGDPVVIAAYTFENQGPNSTFDPHLADCSLAQDASVGYHPTGMR